MAGRELAVTGGWARRGEGVGGRGDVGGSVGR